MGAASLVATALGIVLLIVTAYILVGGVLVTSETVVEAQKDMTAVQVKMLGTSLEITDVTNGTPIYIQVANTGNEPIRDFDNMDMYITTPGGEDLYVNPTHWTIPTSQLDPGGQTTISLNTGPAFSEIEVVQVTTANGISAYWSAP